jgi:hypothetical protein
MVHRLFVLCLSLSLFLSACKPQAPAFVPVTGGKSASAPAQVELARNNVLHYIVSSGRLATLPRDADWSMEVNPRSEREYRFHNADWLIMIRLANTDDGPQQVLIFNKGENVSWTGYVTTDGKVVDTYYVR